MQDELFQDLEFMAMDVEPLNEEDCRALQEFARALGRWRRRTSSGELRQRISTILGEIAWDFERGIPDVGMSQLKAFRALAKAHGYEDVVAYIDNQS